MPSLHSPFFSLCGACLTMRGAVAPSALPEASRQSWLLPPSGGAPPLRPREFMRGWQPLHPPAGAPREHGKAMLGTRVTFPSRGKSPKARRGCAPRPPEGDRAKSVSLFAPAPPAASRNPLDRAFSHNKRPICHFGFMGKSVLFFPLVSSREHFLFSIRGSAGGLPPRIPQILYSRNQYR